MVTIWVSDLQRALEFYVDVLGMVKTAEFHDGVLPDIAWVVPSPASTVALATEVGLEVAPIGDPRVGRFTGMVFTSNEIEETYAELRAKGVRFTLELIRHPYGDGDGDQEARFVDPDGNEFLLHT